MDNQKLYSVDELREEFVDFYGGTSDDIKIYFAPGRVNLIGEHTDYNGGYVMPFSLQYGTYLLVRKVSDKPARFRSKNFPFYAQVCMAEKIFPVGKTWVNYPLGVIREFTEKGFDISGIEFLYAGNIPNGAGLSSSASIEMVTAFALNELFHGNLEMLDLVKLSQRAENYFVGMNCGIMDQFAVGFGQRNKVIILDCDSLNYQLVNVPIEGYRLIIANTNKVRQLADSKYNERRAECEEVVRIISKVKPISNLGRITADEWPDLRKLISNGTLRKRADHVIFENQRVQESIKAFESNKLALFGEKMIASHESLRTDYEVSCFELDVMVEEAMKVEGVLGSRMTGAGFGGCTISLVPESRIEQFISIVGTGYREKTRLSPEFYIAEIGQGVREIYG